MKIIPFSEAQLNSIVNSTAAINVWEGAVRSGKTMSSIIRWMEYVRQMDSTIPYAMVGKTEKTLQRNIITPMMDMFPKAVTYNMGTGVVKIGKYTCYAYGAVDERSEGKLRGATLAGAYVDEVTLYPQSFFEMLRTRCSVPGAKLFVTTNPDSSLHWFKRDILDSDSQYIKRFKFTIDDNPALSDDYKNMLKSSFTGLFYKRFILGEWCLAEGLVYSSFVGKDHIVKLDSDRKFKYATVGVDYGTTNPAAFIMIEYDNIGGPYYITNEYYYDGKKNRPKTDDEYVNDLINFINGKVNLQDIYVDPSALSFKTALKRKSVSTKKAENEVVDGVLFINSQIGMNKLYINSTCSNLIREMQSYSWDENYAQKYGEDRPIKADDHSLDALRYALYTKFGKQKGGFIGGFKI